MLESGAAGTACSPAGTIVRFGLGRHVLRVNIRVLGCGIEQRPRRQEGVKRDPPGVSYRMRSEGKGFPCCVVKRAPLGSAALARVPPPASSCSESAPSPLATRYRRLCPMLVGACVGCGRRRHCLSPSPSASAARSSDGPRDLSASSSASRADRSFCVNVCEVNPRALRATLDLALLA